MVVINNTCKEMLKKFICLGRLGNNSLPLNKTAVPPACPVLLSYDITYRNCIEMYIIPKLHYLHLMAPPFVCT